MNMDISMDANSGGFLNDTSSVSGEKNLRRAQNIVPVMIGQIIRSSGDFQIWEIPVRMLTFIGILRKVNESTTKITYEIEDETGTITTLRWLEVNRSTPEPTLEINTYVRIYGLLRDQNGVKQVFIVRILPLEDLNELTNHLLEVTYATLKAEQIFKANNTHTVSVNVDDNSMFNNDCTGMSTEQAIVFKIIQAENETECGIERNDIKARVPERILHDVDQIIHFLTSEGHIYTTRTDDHFKAT
ncbi:replication protein A 32 kDa subunit-like [Vespa mandarinia]|uniref:replication protein A 32 kDa subunit-like n=1 Tax=Vespa mandarinia TaxID=7446 RepID=UPI001610D672|nr:replication protein A 32 kDa subunit-like [Vespa mandarinia]